MPPVLSLNLDMVSDREDEKGTQALPECGSLPSLFHVS